MGTSTETKLFEDWIGRSPKGQRRVTLRARTTKMFQRVWTAVLTVAPRPDRRQGIIQYISTEWHTHTPVPEKVVVDKEWVKTTKNCLRGTTQKVRDKADVICKARGSSQKDFSTHRNLDGPSPPEALRVGRTPTAERRTSRASSCSVEKMSKATQDATQFFSSQGASASQKTAAHFPDAFSRRSGMAGEASDAVSAFVSQEASILLSFLSWRHSIIRLEHPRCTLYVLKGYAVCWTTCL